MREIYGVGDVKLKQYGAAFLKAILDHCAATGTVTDVSPPPRPAEPPPVQPPLKVSPREEKAFGLFREESAIEDVMQQMQLGRSTISDYLRKFILIEKPRSIRAWVDDDLYQRVATAARHVGTERLKPIFLALGEKVSYDVIRLVVTHLNVRSGESGA